MASLPDTIIAFTGTRCLGLGTAEDVATAVKQEMDRYPGLAVLIFDAVTSRPVEIDLRGSLADVRRRLAGQPRATEPAVPPSAPRGPGRPKLGVVAREVTLLPRHWDWLSQQPGGASVAIRKLVEDARRASADKDRAREAQESLHRFMSAMAGDYPGYEASLRALYAKDQPGFTAAIGTWPADVREHAARLAAPAFAAL